MTKVKNLNGTTDNTPPSGYATWKDWWEKKTSRTFSSCSCSTCDTNAAVGAHVQKYGSSDNKWYIVPLCRSCNSGKKNTVFEVRTNDLVAVNSN